ncbi:alpha/beta fold hydrolase [Streptomyces sp. NPDC091289]|uniref:alpha/beta fold hydrolase n=1 Tax=Streptomyces sp. NPDC091289 TaxID=3365989 RepID=UPI0037F40B18
MKHTALTIDGVAHGFAEYGDPHGRPVVLHHGLLGDAGLPDVWDAWAWEAGVRLIALDRPGHGLSDPVPMSAVADWTPLVLPVLAALEVDAFDVLGVSAGAPYAYALAAALPERVRRVWVLSGLPYVADDAIRHRYPEAAEPVWTFYREAPEDEVAARFAGAAERLADVFASSPSTLAALTGLAGHGWRGPAREVRLQTRPWGFDPAGVAQPVRLWHAPADEEVPFPAAEATAALFPSARLTEQRAPDHVPSGPTLRELFEELRAVARS